MNPTDYFRALCRYNQWMNEKIYAVCEAIPDDVRKEDKGAFFRSIHGTLSHILLADKVWLSRFTGQPLPFAFRSLDQELFSDFAELQKERRKTDEALAAWVDSLTVEALSAPFTFTTLQGVTGTYLLGHLTLHLFNHQTHHRGQLTTLLEQSGFDSGVTDLAQMTELKVAKI